MLLPRPMTLLSLTQALAATSMMRQHTIRGLAHLLVIATWRLVAWFVALPLFALAVLWHDPLGTLFTLLWVVLLAPLVWRGRAPLLRANLFVISLITVALVA